MKFNQHGRVAAASLGVLATLLLWGGAASAGHEDRPGHECREARRICHHAERVAMRACAHICESGSGGASCRDEWPPTVLKSSLNPEPMANFRFLLSILMVTILRNLPILNTMMKVQFGPQTAKKLPFSPTASKEKTSYLLVCRYT